MIRSSSWSVSPSSLTSTRRLCALVCRPSVLFIPEFNCYFKLLCLCHWKILIPPFPLTHSPHFRLFSSVWHFLTCPAPFQSYYLLLHGFITPCSTQSILPQTSSLCIPTMYSYYGAELDGNGRVWYSSFYSQYKTQS